MISPTVLVNTVATSLYQTLLISPMEAFPERINMANLQQLVGAYADNNGDKGMLHIAKDDKVASALLYELTDMFLRRTFYVKYYFSLESHRRTGLVRELLHKAVDLAMQARVTNLSACIQDANMPSIKLAESLEFREFEINFVKQLKEQSGHPPDRLHSIGHQTDKDFLSDTILASIRRYDPISEIQIYDPNMLPAFVLPYLNSTEGHWVLGAQDAGHMPKFFALCKKVENAFKDYLSIDYIFASSDADVDILLGAIELFAQEIGLKEVGISVHHADRNLIGALLRCGYVLCDRTYVRELRLL